MARLAGSAAGQVLAPARIDTLPAGGLGHAARQLLMDGNGHFLAAGVLDNAYLASTDLGAALYDAQGGRLAQRRFSRGGAENVAGVATLRGGGYLLYGASSGYATRNCPSAWTVLASFDENPGDPCAYDTLRYSAYAMRLDAGLDTVWTRGLGELASVGSMEGVLDAEERLRLFFPDKATDSLCMVTVSPDGAAGARACFHGARYADMRAVAEPGGTFLVAGSQSDPRAGVTNSWLYRLDGQGRTLWTRTFGPYAGEFPRLMHVTPEGMVLCYWRRTTTGPDGGIAEVEMRITGETVATTVLRQVSDIHAATGRHRHLGGLLIYPPVPGPQSSRVERFGLSGDSVIQERVDSWYVPPLTVQAVRFGDADNLWFSGNVGGSSTSKFVFGRMRLDQPPRFPDSLKAGPRVYREGDSVKLAVSARDDYFPGSVRHSLAGDERWQLFDSAAGMFAWKPADDWYGDTTFRFTAVDTTGQRDSLPLRIVFRNVNDVPWFDFPGPGRFLKPEDGIYDRIRFGDADKEPLRFTLLASPAGLTLDDSGRVRWYPAAGQRGFFPLAIRLSDSAASVDRSFNLWVEDTLPFPTTNRVGRQSVLIGDPYDGIGIMLRCLDDTVRTLNAFLTSDQAYPPTYTLSVFGVQERASDKTSRVEVELYDGFLDPASEVRQSGSLVASRYLASGPRLTFTVTLSHEVKIHTHHGGLPNPVAVKPRLPVRSAARTGKRDVNALGRALGAGTGTAPTIRFRAPDP